MAAWSWIRASTKQSCAEGTERRSAQGGRAGAWRSRGCVRSIRGVSRVTSIAVLTEISRVVGANAGAAVAIPNSGDNEGGREIEPARVALRPSHSRGAALSLRTLLVQRQNVHHL